MSRAYKDGHGSLSGVDKALAGVAVTRIAGSVLIAGAGYVGGHLAESLASDGADVYCVRRGIEAEQDIAHSDDRGASGRDWVTWLQGDLRDPALATRVSAMVRSVDHVVITVSPPRGERTGTGRDVGTERCEGTESAESSLEQSDPFLASIVGSMNLARHLRAGKIIYTSSAAVYANRDGGVVTEDSPLVSGDDRGNGMIDASEGHRLERDMRGARMLAAERLLLAERVSSLYLLRITGIYGPGRNPLPRYLHPERLPMRGEFWTNRVRVEDAVRAIRMTMEGSAPEGPLNCTDDCPAKAIEVARWIAEKRGVAWPDRSEGAGERSAADRSGGASAATGMDSMEMRLPRSNKCVSNARLRNLGWEPHYPSYREGMLEFLD